MSIVHRSMPHEEHETEQKQNLILGKFVSHCGECEMDVLPCNGRLGNGRRWDALNDVFVNYVFYLLFRIRTRNHIYSNVAANGSVTNGQKVIPSHGESSIGCASARRSEVSPIQNQVSETAFLFFLLQIPIYIVNGMTRTLCELCFCVSEAERTKQKTKKKKNREKVVRNVTVKKDLVSTLCHFRQSHFLSSFFLSSLKR